MLYIVLIFFFPLLVELSVDHRHYLSSVFPMDLALQSVHGITGEENPPLERDPMSFLIVVLLIITYIEIHS